MLCLQFEKEAQAEEWFVDALGTTNAIAQAVGGKKGKKALKQYRKALFQGLKSSSAAPRRGNGPNTNMEELRSHIHSKVDLSDVRGPIA